MSARAERVDVVVTGVRDASPGGFVELASELRDMTGLAVNQVQVALLKGELIVRRSMAASEAQQAVDELKGLGAEVEVRPAGERGQVVFESTESHALTPELEPDPEIDFAPDPLMPPPSFGQLSSPSHAATDIIPDARSATPRLVESGLPFHGEPAVGPNPVPLYPLQAVSRPPGGPMHPASTHPMHAVPMPPAGPMHAGSMAPAMPMHPGPAAGFAGPSPIPAMADATSLELDVFARGLDSPEIELDDEPPPVDAREVKAELEEVDSGRSKPRRPITRGIEDVVVEEIEVDTDDSVATPLPVPRGPTFDEPILQLDRGPDRSTPALGSSIRTTSSSSLVASSSSLTNEPAVDLRPHRIFGREPIASTLFGLAVGLGLGAVVAHATVRNGARERVEGLETELGEAFTRPLAVRDGKVRDASAIEADLDAAYGKARGEFVLWWLGIGLPLGFGLGRFRRPGS